MKKQINPTIKAHLIRSAFYVILLLAVCVIPFALAQRNTTKQRVAKPKATTHLAGAGKQSGAPAGLAGTVQRPQRKPGAVDRNLPYDTRQLPALAPKFPYSSIRDPNAPVSKTAPARRQISGSPAKSSGPAARHPMRLLPQPKLPRVVLYDQYDNAGLNSTGSQNFEPDFDAFDDFTADDFVVPGGETWNINEVDVLGVYFNGLGPANSFNVFIYQDSGTFPGTLVFSGTNLPYTTADNLNFVVPLSSPAVLTAGTYWVSVQCNMDFGVGGQWGWTDRTVQAFSGAAFMNPGGGFACPGGNGWVRKPDCVATADPDQVYRLVGTTGGGGTPTPTPTATPTCTPGAGGGLLIGSGMTTGYLPNGWEPTLASNTVNYTFSNSQAAPNEFALFDTHDAWGFTIIKDAITSNGHTYTEFTPAQLAGFSFSDYRVIILNWDDTNSSDFLADYTAAIPALEAYINAGGVVWVQAAIQTCDSIPMPFGGQGNGCDFGDNDPIVDPANPMMVGMPDPIPGNAASHLSFSGLPGLAHIVVNSNTSGQPALYELFPGGGGCTPTPTPTPTATPGGCEVTGSIDLGDPTQVDRLFRSGIPQTCPASTTCALFGDGLPHHYDEYSFTNTTGVTQCVTVDTNTACTGTNFIFIGAYLGSFDPNNICTNWIGDSGGSPNPQQAFQVNVDNGQTLVIVVSEVTPDAGCPAYTVTLTNICGGGGTPTPTPTCPPGGGAAGPWTLGNPYPITDVRYGFAQTATHLYVFGGVSDGTRVNNVNRMDLGTGTWEPRAPMPFTSEAPTCALMDATGMVYCTEGDTGSGFASYDIATDTWTPLAAIPGGDHYGSASGAFNGNVFVAGGTTGFVNTVQVYDVAGNTWSAGTAAPNAYLLAGYQQVGQFLYVVGGFSPAGPSNNATTLRLDMSSAPGVWESGPAFTPARADFGLAYDAGTNKLYALGGDADGGGFFDSTNVVDELDLSGWPGGTWNPSPPDLPLPNRQANQAGFYGAGDIWSVGGIDGATFIFSAEVQHRNNGGGCPTPTPTATPTPTPITPTPTPTPGTPTPTPTPTPGTPTPTPSVTPTSTPRPTPTPRPRPTPFPRPTP